MMDYRQLGRTGVRISSFILGCGNFGGVGNIANVGCNLEESKAILDRAVDLGINCFDTSNIYGGGASEDYLGAWLRQRRDIRDKLLICSKVGHPVGSNPNDHGLSRRHIVEQVEKSLLKLGIDYLDLYMMHTGDAHTPLEETLSALDHLVQTGKIRYFGCSGLPAWKIVETLWHSDLRKLSRVHWIQDSYSLIDRRLEEEMVPACVQHGIAITPFSPLAGGLLTGKYRRGEAPPDGSRVALMPNIYSGMLGEDTIVGLEALERFARQRGSSMAALSLAWLLAKPYVTAPVIGPRRSGHLDVVEEALSIILTDEELEEMTGFFSGGAGIRRIKLTQISSGRPKARVQV